MLRKSGIKAKPPVVHASFEDLRAVKHTGITLTGDMVAVLQNCITFTIKNKGLNGMIDDTTAPSVHDVMQLMTKLAQKTLREAEVEVPPAGYVTGKDLMKGDR